MSADVFFDTNVLVYAHDQDAGVKHAQARELVAAAWRGPVWPCISVQVLQELYVNLHRKGVHAGVARETVLDYAHWRVAENTVALLERGIAEMAGWQLSFWDGLVLAAARSMGATVVYSEDLSVTQDYSGIRVTNPFT